jgi:type II secretory pathway component PulM
MKTRTRRVLGWGVAVLVLVFVLLCLPFNPPKLSAAEVGARVDLLNEKAAIVTPHLQLGKKTREANLALFEKVERGEQLTAAESASYRVLYQLILKDKQGLFIKMDKQLTVLTDYEPGENNNVGTRGIEGSHDHHDASAGANLAALRSDLGQLEQASGITGSYARVRYAISAYKDLDDILMHMAIAPQTKSVPRVPEAPADELQAQFEPMMEHFKRAQFELVNSPAYLAEIRQALDRFTALVVLVQDRVHGQLGPVERSLSGQWGSWRSLTPPTRDVSAKRIPPATPAAP